MMNDPSDNTDATSARNLLLTRIAETLDLDHEQVELDTDLLASDRMDSIAIVTLVTFLEEDLSASIPIEAIVPDNFRTARKCPPDNRAISAAQTTMVTCIYGAGVPT